MRQFGVPSEESWPYKISKYRTKPDAAAMKTAPWHNIDEVASYRCDGAGGSREATLTNILRAHEAGLPVNFGFACPKDWKTTTTTAASRCRTAAMTAATR